MIHKKLYNKLFFIKNRHFRKLLRMLVSLAGVDFKAHAVRHVDSLKRIKGSKVLVVGCGSHDCRYFVEKGAAEVHGLDPRQAEYQHPRVRYFQASAEEIPLEDNAYDIVFCFATMEHVQNIAAAFSEMVRVAKVGGLIYSYAGPLWNSKRGHHKEHYLDGYPWLHLRATEEEMLDYVRKNKVPPSPSGVTAENHIPFMLHSDYFNRLPSTKYVEVCNGLKGVEVIANEISFGYEEDLTEEILAELKAKGFSREELLSLAHTFIARKTSPS